MYEELGLSFRTKRPAGKPIDRDIGDFSSTEDLSLIFTGEQEAEAPAVERSGHVGLSLGFPDIEGDNG